MRNILLDGIDTSLGASFAARCLQSSYGRISYSTSSPGRLSQQDIIDSVFYAGCEITGSAEAALDREQVARGLHAIDRDQSFPLLTPAATAAIDEIWHFANSSTSLGKPEICESLIATSRSLGATLNYVVAGFDGHSESEIRNHEILQRCNAQNIKCRIFHTSLVIAAVSPKLAQEENAIWQFLAVLHSLKAEVDERSPDYFDFQALRCKAPAHAALNLISAAVASDLLLRIAQTEGSTGLSFSIFSPENVPFSVLCERIGIAFGISLLAVEDSGSLSAIDRVFNERLGDLPKSLVSAVAGSCDIESYRIAGLPPDSAVLDEEAQIALFESVRRAQDEALAARRQLVAELPGKLVRRSIIKNGSELNYYVAGSAAVTIVVLNAYGQGLEYWYPLLAELMENYRVVIWEQRGTFSSPAPFALTDQVNDVDAIVRNEGIDKCHLLGWCTGPKVAIEFCLGNPSTVCSMAFLNATFKCDGGSEDFDSPYEHNLESLCRLLLRKPALATSIMKNLQAGFESEAEALEDAAPEQLSISVLSRMNPNLRSHVLAPFMTEETTVNYAHQLVDFWSRDSRPQAAEIHAPVLLIGAEYDQVAIPAASEAAAGFFPNAHYVQVHGATHYCLYDQPQLIAGLLKSFFQKQDELAGSGLNQATAAASYTHN